MVWHNPHACDTLGTYASREEAELAGENWLMEMIAVDPNPEEAEEAYEFEVLDPKEVPPTSQQIEEAARNKEINEREPIDWEP